MGRESVVIIANPRSGRGRTRRTAEAVAVRLRDRGVRVAVRHTSAPGEAEAVAAEVSASAQDHPDCVVACGGDGTIQEVANALASLHADRPQDCPALGLAPAGRCNDFARALGVPSDPMAVAELLATGEPRAIDLGRANGRYFCTVATVGIDAEVSSFVDTMHMPLKGTVAYLYGALCVLARYRPCSLRIDGDVGLIERPVILASSANTSSYGGAIRIAPQANPVDGFLDLCIIDPVPRRRLLTLLSKAVMGRHGSCPEVQFVRTRRLSIESAEPIELWADGERITRTPVTIEAVPEAIPVILPHDWKPAETNLHADT